jgi:hypothetical protein
MKGSSNKKSKRELYKVDTVALPAFLSGGRSRARQEVSMSAATSREFRQYIRWASTAARMSVEEVQVAFFENVLPGYFRADEAWQAARKLLKASPAESDDDDFDNELESAMDNALSPAEVRAAGKNGHSSAGAGPLATTSVPVVPSTAPEANGKAKQ